MQPKAPLARLRDQGLGGLNDAASDRADRIGNRSMGWDDKLSAQTLCHFWIVSRRRGADCDQGTRQSKLHLDQIWRFGFSSECAIDHTLSELAPLGGVQLFILGDGGCKDGMARLANDAFQHMAGEADA